MRDLYVKLFDLLDRREKVRFLLLLAMILLMGLFEAIGVGSILPFLSVLSDPSVIKENAWLSAAYAVGGFDSDRAFLMAIGIGVFCIVFFGLLFKTLTLYAIIHFTQMRAYALSTRLLEGYLEQPYVWFLNRHSADLAKSILDEVNQVVNGVMLPAIQLIAFSVVTVFLVGLVVVIDPVIALSAAVLLGVVYGALFLLVRQLLARLGADRVRANRARYQIVQEATGGIKDVKVLSLEGVLAHRFRAPARRMAQCQTLSQVISQTPRHVLEAVLFGGMLVLALHLILTRPGGVGEVIPIMGLYAFTGARLFPALQQVYHMLTSLRFGMSALESLHRDIREIRETAANSARAQPETPPVALGLTERLELRDVHYSYPQSERAALGGCDMIIAARSTVGIVGGTGAGKTTAVDIILGLLVPQAGMLLVDGQQIDDDTRVSWRRSIGYVPQQIFLADDTVAGNIAFGIPPERIDQAAVERAARIAELHDFVVTELDRGYETHVGERGVRLSGGQRQRIGIARALYHDPDVLVLDEATSALDNLTERAVMDAVHNIGHAKTVIMIAHRLTTVRVCDQIFLIKHGRVAAHGSYDRLLAESEEFQAMASGGV